MVFNVRSNWSLNRLKTKVKADADVLAVQEVTEIMPWLDVTSSSDSETEQSDSPTNQETEKRLKTKWSCIRQAALLTLKIILKNATKRDLCHYWKLFLPSGISKGGSANLNESDLDQSNCGLLISILFDPAARARNLAVDVLRHFLQQCKQFISKVCESANPKFSKKLGKVRVQKYINNTVLWSVVH